MLPLVSLLLVSVFGLQIQLFGQKNTSDELVVQQISDNVFRCVLSSQEQNRVVTRGQRPYTVTVQLYEANYNLEYPYVGKFKLSQELTFDWKYSSKHGDRVRAVGNKREVRFTIDPKAHVVYFVKASDSNRVFAQSSVVLLQLLQVPAAVSDTNGAFRVKHEDGNGLTIVQVQPRKPIWRERVIGVSRDVMFSSKEIEQNSHLSYGQTYPQGGNHHPQIQRQISLMFHQWHYRTKLRLFRWSTKVRLISVKTGLPLFTVDITDKKAVDLDASPQRFEIIDLLNRQQIKDWQCRKDSFCHRVEVKYLNRKLWANVIVVKRNNSMAEELDFPNIAKVSIGQVYSFKVSLGTQFIPQDWYYYDFEYSPRTVSILKWYKNSVRFNSQSSLFTIGQDVSIPSDVLLTSNFKLCKQFLKQNLTFLNQVELQIDSEVLKPSVMLLAQASSEDFDGQESYHSAVSGAEPGAQFSNELNSRLLELTDAKVYNDPNYSGFNNQLDVVQRPMKADPNAGGLNVMAPSFVPNPDDQFEVGKHPLSRDQSSINTDMGVITLNQGNQISGGTHDQASSQLQEAAHAKSLLHQHESQSFGLPDEAVPMDTSDYNSDLVKSNTWSRKRKRGEVERLALDRPGKWQRLTNWY